MSERDGGDMGSPSIARPGTVTRAAIVWWVRTIVVMGAILMAAGAFIALAHPVMLVSPHAEINDAVRVYAGYLASRNLGLAILLIVAISLRARRTLNTLMLLTVLIQVLDAGIDCVEGRWAILPGVIVLGVLFVVGAAGLSGHPFWKKEAWMEG